MKNRCSANDLQSGLQKFKGVLLNHLHTIYTNKICVRNFRLRPSVNVNFAKKDLERYKSTKGLC